MNTLSSIVASGLCCGCGVCAGVCPAGSIEMKFNRIGEYNPYPTGNRCTGCGLCMKVCPCSSESENEDALATEFFGSIPDIRHEKETGYFIQAVSGYSIVHRQESASGGLATWLMESLLTSGMVDAVACAKPGTGGHPLFTCSLSSTPEDIRSGSGSCYYPVELSSIVRTMIEKEGRYAVIALPCACRALRLAAGRIPRLAERMKYLLGLTCGHTASSFFAEYICAMAGPAPGKLDSMRFRIKSPSTPVSDYNTCVSCRTTNGVETRNIRWSAGVWDAFMNRFFTPLSCDFCDDVFAECSDAAFMDAWLPEHVNDDSGNSIMLIRNPEIERLVEKTKERDTVLNPIDISRVIKSQASALITKRAWLHERKRTASSHGQPYPAKRFERHEPVPTYAEKMLISAQWYISRSSGRLWMESGGNLERFNDMSRTLRNRLKWANRLAALSSDPLATAGNWRKKIIGILQRKMRHIPQAIIKPACND